MVLAFDCAAESVFGAGRNVFGQSRATRFINSLFLFQSIFLFESNQLQVKSKRVDLNIIL